MKKSIVIKANKLNKNIKFSINYKTAIYFSLMLTGIIIGAFIAENGSEKWNTLFYEIIDSFLIAKASNGVLVNFCSSFLPVFIIILFVYICGTCGLGSIFSSFSPVLMGIYCGVSVTSFYLKFGVQGIVYCLLINLVLYAITAATLIKCCCESTRISKEILIYLISGKSEGKPLLKEYTLKYLILLLPVVFGSIFSALMFSWLSNLFSFINWFITIEGCYIRSARCFYTT